MTDSYIYDNLEHLIKASNLHRLIICRELKISLACLDDFLQKRLYPTREMFDILRRLFDNSSTEMITGDENG